MAEIQGQFDVSLSIPVAVTPDFLEPNLSLCQFQIDGDRVIISPLNVAEAIPYPDGDYEPSKLTEIRVWIIREIDLGREQEDSLTLSPDEERLFERVLVEATRRFVTIIKHMTNQWDLDTRHPIYAYDYDYSLGDTQLNTVWPLQQGAKRMPEYAHGVIIFHTRDFKKELNQEMWQELANEVLRPISVPLYDELLHDAKNFRSHMRYDASALYAAIAAELMLEEACGSLLRTKGNLSNKQCAVELRNKNNQQILNLIRELDASVSVKYEDVRKLFNLRNKIAHGQAKTVTGQEAAEAINSAENLKQHLKDMLYTSMP
ncbi:MAG: hypothetical protein FJ004_09595 [Chloroflexi bacterium]|nr:hypothetical protein [Chloroflexota bacterium]